MIKDFDQVRLQLKELAEVINAFKSEAVQLRIVELILGGASVATASPQSTGATPPVVLPVRKRRTKRAPKNASSASAPAKRPSRTPAKGRPGARTTLDTLISEGFFKTPKTIGKIVERPSKTSVKSSPRSLAHSSRDYSHLQSASTA